MDAFAVLELPRRASLTEEAVRGAYFQASKVPGADQEALNAALQTLVTPEKRLKHLMEVAAPDDARNWRAVAMPERLMDLFMRVGRTKSATEMLLKRRQEAKSALARALLQPEVLALREQAEGVASSLSEVMEERTNGLAELDAALAEGDPEAWRRVAEAQAHLAYLSKWQAQVRELLLGLM